MRNIILTGFMGTGKTSAGRLASEHLQRTFVDMDATIEARRQKTVAQIFKEDGEDFFRRMEADLCEELGAQENLIIATGGGALMQRENREALQRNGIIVCLTCDLDEVLKRLDLDESSIRPLLDGEDRRNRAFQLLETRRDIYKALPWQIDTTHISLQEVVDQIVRIAHLKVIPVQFPHGTYDIWMGMHALDYIGEILHACGIPSQTRVAVVCNPVVAPHYLEGVLKSLRGCAYAPFHVSMPDGEENKTLATVEQLYSGFLAGGLDRRDTALALGGGVTGDVVGFAAATYMRGVRFVQAPTTLLSMVDSSVGGKTGVDLPEGKNLVGAFLQPAVVIMDPLTLKTLPERELRSGMGEAIKHAVLSDREFCDVLAQQNGVFSNWWSENGIDWLQRTLKVKIDVVEEDPYEKGKRALLNLGHTVGHALELVSEFKINHGEAVSIGMVVEAEVAAGLEIAEKDLPEKLRLLLTSWGLPVRIEGLPCSAIQKAIAHDKKKDGKLIRYALPRQLGAAGLYTDISEEAVKAALIKTGAQDE